MRMWHGIPAAILEASSALSPHPAAQLSQWPTSLPHHGVHSAYQPPSKCLLCVLSRTTTSVTAPPLLAGGVQRQWHLVWSMDRIHQWVLQGDRVALSSAHPHPSRLIARGVVQLVAALLVGGSMRL